MRRGHTIGRLVVAHDPESDCKVQLQPRSFRRTNDFVARSGQSGGLLFHVLSWESHGMSILPSTDFLRCC